MFLRAIKQNVPSQYVRSMYWMCREKNNYVLGLKKETIDLIGGVRDIEITSESLIKKNEGLFLVQSNLITTNIINAPFDCSIICYNRHILKTINHFPEIKDIGWVVKIVPIVINYNKCKRHSCKNFTDYLDYDYDSQEIPRYCLNHF